jgi:lipopolysaccharide/colanic/teichoic acid biosynthesis glycosyltransferase
VLRIVRPRVLDDSENISIGDASAQTQSVWEIPPSSIAMAVKRGIDVSLSAGLGLIALPLMVLIALAIRLDSPGPALFRASRIGRHGTHFSMLKFRTMVADAETRFHEIAHLNVANGMVKIPDDPRVTRIGKWLRRFSLDELPQVYNVLLGHMSIVGPRPHDVDDLPPDQIRVDRRLRMRPGLTGLWQVTARSDPNLETRLYLDRVYVDGWSLKTDLSILARTVPAVMKGQGGRIATPDQPIFGEPNGSAAPHVGTAYLSIDAVPTATGHIE